MRKIAVVTGSRSDFGHLRWLIADLVSWAGIEIQLVVTGMHLSQSFGHTVDEIAFPIAAKVPMLLHGDGADAIATSTGLGVIGMTQALNALQPECLVILGDRFEILATATAAMLLHIPIAHIHGGEITENVLDDQIRHAITKMSHVHFVATESYRRRILQMGEPEDRVFLVGSPGLDVIERGKLVNRKTLEGEIDWSLRGPLAIATYHPVTLVDDPASGIHTLLDSLDRVPELRVLFTGVNADEGHSQITSAINSVVISNPDRFHAVYSLGQVNYISAIRIADLVLGNSSSGIVEAPAIGTPTVNIGDRQRGRLRASTVIDVAMDPSEIALGIRNALNMNEIDKSPPYGTAGASEKVARILHTIDPTTLRGKTFIDQ